MFYLYHLFLQDEYKYLYDVMLHWYMTNPEYRIFDKEENPKDVKMRNSIRRSTSVLNKTLTGNSTVL